MFYVCESGFMWWQGTLDVAPPATTSGAPNGGGDGEEGTSDAASGAVTVSVSEEALSPEAESEAARVYLESPPYPAISALNFAEVCVECVCVCVCVCVWCVVCGW